MIIWKLKSCPRCRGDIFIDKNHYGWYKQCLQCGYLCSLTSTIEAHQYGKGKKEKEPSKQTV